MVCERQTTGSDIPTRDQIEDRLLDQQLAQASKRALRDLEIGTWFAGLRRDQSDSRGKLKVLQKQAKQFKFHPILDQSNKQLHEYLTANKLPYHPLWEKGYVSVGDWHTTVALQDGMSEQDTRFHGLKRECGLHEFGDGDGI